ncbi:MAG: amidohydrolase [Acidobacteriota bacterium]
MDRKNPKAEAVAVSGGKFTAVGSNAAIRSLAGDSTRVVDAAGRIVLPGFNDAHVHFAAIGNKFSTIDLRSARTSAEAAAMLENYVRFLPKGRWILGGGWNAANLPSRQTVDPITPDNPVFVYSSDANAAFANAVALSKAKITKLTRDPNGGVIERDADGRPTGILRGSAVRLAAAVVPPDHTRNWPEVLQTASNYAASLGVTSVQDMHSDELGDVYRQLEREGKLKTRVYDCSPISAWQRLAAKNVKAATGDAMVRTGCVKAFSDGDEADASQLRRDIAGADKAGLQVMAHAIGPKANGIVLDAFENAISLNGRRDRRFRVEHAQDADAADLIRFRRSYIIASMQPWLFNRTNPSIYKRHLQLGTELAFGSDASIADFDPLLGIRTASGTGRIDLDAAIFAYTAGSGFAEFQEKVKGTIAVGMLADAVILSAGLFNDSQIELTIVDGSVVYRKIGTL